MFGSPQKTRNFFNTESVMLPERWGKVVAKDGQYFEMKYIPLVMELPLMSPASCELWSVIHFLATKKNSAKDIHTELCQVYGEGCMSSGMVRRWVK
ncbi:hypothetical protein LAZ67_6003101 [Cordylochernes scorpioides]|uniref:Mos1 transposase HTH domain-containing protein n=1 Tax=Cordylochernes scorpioides TaxID=51811 RepID=A0ABY6KKA4_9ARAC|nr:hypothetical protein LAZ67_6003101 [Cordylochernes scorpioides]